MAFIPACMLHSCASPPLPHTLSPPSRFSPSPLRALYYLSMLGVGTLCSYPHRKPSEEMRMTVGGFIAFGAPPQRQVAWRTSVQDGADGVGRMDPRLQPRAKEAAGKDEWQKGRKGEREKGGKGEREKGREQGEKEMSANWWMFVCSPVRYNKDGRRLVLDGGWCCGEGAVEYIYMCKVCISVIQNCVI